MLSLHRQAEKNVSDVKIQKTNDKKFRNVPTHLFFKNPAIFKKIQKIHQSSHEIEKINDNYDKDSAFISHLFISFLKSLFFSLYVVSYLSRKNLQKLILDILRILKFSFVTNNHTEIRIR